MTTAATPAEKHRCNGGIPPSNPEGTKSNMGEANEHMVNSATVTTAATPSYSDDGDNTVLQ